MSTTSVIVWTDYFKYRTSVRGFDLDKLEYIIRYSNERYFDTETGRSIVVGRYDQEVVIIPYDIEQDTITPITVHVITRQQIRFRVRTGRFTNA